MKKRLSIGVGIVLFSAMMIMLQAEIRNSEPDLQKAEESNSAKHVLTGNIKSNIKVFFAQVRFATYKKDNNAILSLTIKNEGKAPVQLTGIEVLDEKSKKPLAKESSFNEWVYEGNTRTAKPVSRVEIKPGEVLRFKQLSRFLIKLRDLNQPLVNGDNCLVKLHSSEKEVIEATGKIKVISSKNSTPYKPKEKSLPNG